MSIRSLSSLALVLTAVACGPTTRNGNHGGDGGNVPQCTDGASQACYSGSPGTQGIGPCTGGTQTCVGGQWGACQGEVVPTAENCTDGIDNNCNGMTDENVDLDGDGYTTCGGDCCDSTECSDPGKVNPGAFDAPGNGIDDDCDGHVDNAIAMCDTGISPTTTNAMDFAKAIDLCQTATASDKKWGVISAKLTLADDTGTPAAASHAVRPVFGGVLPKLGGGLAILSTGHAAAKNDNGYQDFQSGAGMGTSSGFPTAWYAANSQKIPNAPGCPTPLGSTANDPVMLTLQIRVPTNAQSFKLDTNFFSSEFPEYTCSAYNDFFVVLLDSTFNGTPANPTDHNLAFYKDSANHIYPVGVNLAFGNTGLFTECKNGATGCAPDPFNPPVAGSISTCTGTGDLTNTGFDTVTNGSCETGSFEGGATGWLETSGNVKPGEVITLRIAIWDMSDHLLDSLAVIDAFQWSLDAAQPGTVIFKQKN